MDGVVLSGGEPTLYQCCAGVANDIRALGYSVKLDTNGLLPEKITEIAPDYLALDIKTTPENYVKFLQAPYNNVSDRLHASITLAKTMGNNAEIRITISPEITTNKIIEDIAELLCGICTVWLQPMRTNTPMLDPSMQKKKTIPMNEIIEYQTILSKAVTTCRIRTSSDQSVRDYL